MAMTPTVLWTKAIYTLDEALPIALDFLGTMAREHPHDPRCSADDFFHAMERSNVTVTAARDCLTYLKSTFAIEFDQLGDIVLPDPKSV